MTLTFSWILRNLEYLEKAILSTKCDNIRASLIVQRNYSLDQTECLKRRLLNKARKDFIRLSVDSNRTADQLTTKQISTMNPEELEQKYQELYHVMNEQDSLINCLIDQQQIHSSSTPSGSSRSSPTEELKFKSGNKKPKEDKEIIEELKTVNEKLRQWVHHLVDGLEKAQIEIHNLKDENNQLRKEVSSSKNSNSNKKIPELPPLEPPTLLYWFQSA